MKIWLPVYQYEDKYEVNILDGVIHELLPEDTDRECALTPVAIETDNGTEMQFHGYGVVLVDKNNNEQIVPIDKIVIEAILKKTVKKTIYHKNGISIDCNYKNLTLKPPAKSESLLKAEGADKFYQYKCVRDVHTGKERLVLDTVYNSYKEFTSATGLTHVDFSRQKDNPDRIIIGIYLWTYNELKTQGNSIKQQISRRLAHSI